MIYKKIIFSLLILLIILIPVYILNRQMEYIHNLEEVIEENKKELDRLSNENHDLRSKIEEKEKTIASQKKEIKEITKKLELLVTFKDAGLDGHSVDDIRKLLDMADKIPYGSPFKSGHYFTSYYGKRNELNFGGSPNGHHAGVDIRPKDRSNTIIRATADGEVVDFGISEKLGKYIIFETDGGYRLKYGHLNTIFWQDVQKQIVKGVEVHKGEKLGIMGNTGTWSTGPHLHLEIHIYDKENETYRELNPRRIIEYIGGDKDGLDR